MPTVRRPSGPVGPASSSNTPTALKAEVASKDEPQVNTAGWNATGKTKRQGTYRINASFGPHVERISPTDVRIKSDLMDVKLEHVHWTQRTSFSYYDVPQSIKDAKAEGAKYPVIEGGFRWLDEPTNEVTVELEKQGKFAVGISMYHPKMLVALGSETGNELNESIKMVGMYDGKPIDKNVNLKEYFGQFRLTHQNMNFSVYGDKIFTVADGKAGSLLCKVGGRLCLYTGKAAIEARDPKSYWDFISQPKDTKMKVMGGGATLQASLQYMLPGGRVGLGVKGEVDAGHLSYEFLGGTASQNHLATSAQVFIVVNPWRSKK